MYSLYVSVAVRESGKTAFEVPNSRFLEYTNESIAMQLSSLSNQAGQCIRSWPCLLMQEGRGEEEAQVAQVITIEQRGSIVQVVVNPLESAPRINNERLWRVRNELDIAQFEFSRNHWAVKDRDLFSILARLDVTFDGGEVARFSNSPLPLPTRVELLGAKKLIADWSHERISDFVLEAGVQGMQAGRQIGSRRDRASAMVEFALENPSAKTAENDLFAISLVQAASDSLELIEGDENGPDSRVEEGDERSSNRVFIVHGREEGARRSVSSFLASLGLEGIVLHEQPSMGRHLLTKFIQEADLATFAVVLMTDDDVGGRTAKGLSPRARQNVILELGYFLSHLGQERVCALITPDLETPSDFDGIVYVRMDESGQWKDELERELRAAGMPVARQAKTPEETWPESEICARCNGPILGPTPGVWGPDGGIVHPYDCLAG